MEQQKNLMLFTTLSILILLGWLFVQHQLWPPPPRALAWDELQPAMIAKLASQHAAAAVGAEPFGLAADLALYATQYPVTLPKVETEPSKVATKLTRWQDLAPSTRKALLLV